jgi:hypothetical protein
MATVMMSTII